MATVIEVMAKLTGNASGMIASFNQAKAAAKSSADSIGVTGAQAKASLDGLTVPAAAIGVGAALASAHIATMASEAEQNVGAVESVFKEYAQTVKDTSAQAAENVGISTSAYQQFASIVGSQLKNMGVPLSDVAGGTEDLIKKGADLASMFGGTTSEAIEAISSMLRGETDPIERYGVSINQAAVEAKMLAMGLTGMTGPAEKNAQLQAKLAILTEQTADATGNFAREGDTAGGAMQRANAKWADAQATLGTALLPAMTKLAELMQAGAKFVSDHTQVVMIFGGIIAGAALGVLAIAGALKAYALWTDLATVATYLFGTAQKALTAGTIIGVIMLIIGIFAYFWTTSEEFRNFWIGLWQSIQDACAPAAEAIGRFIGDMVNGIMGFFDQLGQAGADLWNIFAKGDFTGLFGLEEDSGLVVFLFDLRDAALSLWNILFKGDFTAPIFGLQEDSGLVDFLLGIRENAMDLFNVLFKGDFTGLFGLEEDDPIVGFLLNVKTTAQDLWSIFANGDFKGLWGLEEDSALVDFLFDIRDAAVGVWNIFTKGDFTGPIFGMEEDSAFVDFLFDIREGAQQAIAWVQDLAAGVAGFFGGLAGGAATDIFGFITDSNIGGWLTDMWGKAQTIFAQLGAAWAKVWEFISNAFAVIGPPLFAYIIAGFTMLWDILTGVWNAVGQPLMGIIVAGWNILVDGLKAVWNIIVGVVQGAMDIIAGVIAVVTGIITGNWAQVWDGLGQIFGGVWKIISAIVGNALAFIGSILSNGLDILVNIWNGVWGALGAVLSGFFSNIGAVLGAWLGVIGGIFSAVFGGIWDNVTTVVGGLFNWLGEVFGGFGNWLAGIWAGLAGGASAGATAVTSPIVDAFNAMVGFVTGIFTAVGSFITGVWTWIFNLLTAIGQAFWAEHGAQLTAGWNFIVGIFTAIGAFISGVWNAIVSAVSGFLQWYVGLVVGALTAAWNFIASIFNTVAAFVSSVWNSIVSAVGGFLSWYINLVVSAFTAVWSFISNILNTVFGFIRGVWDGIIGTIRNALNIVGSAVSSGFNAVWSVVSSVFNRVASFLSGIWSGITSGVSSMVGSIGSFFSGIYGQVTGALAGAGRWLWDAGVNIVNGLIGGVKSLAGTIGNAFLSMIPGWIVGPFKAALGIASPSKLFHQFGKWIIQGLGRGVNSEEQTAVAAMTDAARAVENAGSGITIAAPQIAIPEVPNIAAQLALPPLTQDVLLNFVGTSPVEAIKRFEQELKGGLAGGSYSGDRGYNRDAVGGATTTVAPQQAPSVNMTVLVENPWGEGYLEAKVVATAEKAADDKITETARAARGTRGSAGGGY